MGNEPAGAWHELDITEVRARLRTGKRGLTEEEAVRRIEQFGLNQLSSTRPRHIILKFLDQFKSVLIMILIAAAILSFIIGDWTDTVVIFLVITINAFLSLYQELKAEKKMEALKKLADPTAVVVRNGKHVSIPTGQIVPGDMIHLEDGQRIPVDARVMDSNGLEVDESSLTGEPEPTRKMAGRLPRGCVLAERSNMVYTGTIITRGNGRALVVDTGMKTQLGEIASMVKEAGVEQTPLQKRLGKLGAKIAAFAIGVCLLLLTFDILTNWNELLSLTWSNFGGSFLEASILTYISLAVAVIPEGLPVVVMLTLALGMEQMAKHDAIVRRMPCVETLGCTTVICSDKTGTLTRNEMTVRELNIPQLDMAVSISGEGYAPEGSLEPSRPFTGNARGIIDMMMNVSRGCNNASLSRSDGHWKILGDPTEGALVVLAEKRGSGVRIGKRIKEFPFDADRMRMSTVHNIGGRPVVLVKGAPGKILNVCTRVWGKDGVGSLDGTMERRIRKVNRGMARKAYRVLALAYREMDTQASRDQRELDAPGSMEKIESDLVFLGLVGIMDPARGEAGNAISLCRDAGIKVVMITGDQRATAVAIGKALGIVRDDRSVLTGDQLDGMSANQLAGKVNDISVYARASPEHKMKIISALRSRGHVVAMTGDGVNDAPALSRADIGISMGMTGTDVAKEASDMILTDDNFATIVQAVKEGRKIYTNIQRFIRYQLSTNVGAILLLVASSLMGLPIPLSPAQILYINIIMDGPPAMGLSMEPTTEGIMKDPPRDTKENILSMELLSSVLMLGIIMAIWTLLVYVLMDPGNPGNLARARTMAFTTFVMFQLFNVVNCRAYKHSVFQKGLFKNGYIIGAVAFSLLVQVVLIYVPLVRFPLVGSINLFQTVPLGWMDWLMVLVVSSFIFLADEIRTLLVNFIGKRVRRVRSPDRG